MGDGSSKPAHAPDHDCIDQHNLDNNNKADDTAQLGTAEHGVDTQHRLMVDTSMLSEAQECQGNWDDTVQQHASGGRSVGPPEHASGAITFRDMLGGIKQQDAYGACPVSSPALSDVGGAITFRHMLDTQTVQKPERPMPPTNDDSSAHSTNTLQADPSSRLSDPQDGDSYGQQDATASACRESMLAPPLTFRDMLQMSPPCMDAKHVAPTPALSSASLLTSPTGASDLTVGSSPESDFPCLSGCMTDTGEEQLDNRYEPRIHPHNDHEGLQNGSATIDNDARIGIVMEQAHLQSGVVML